MIAMSCTRKLGKVYMIEVKEKMIDGETFTVTQLPARRAIRMKAKLMKIFGPALAHLFVSGDSKGKNNDFVGAFETLASNIDENVFEQICVELLAGVRKNGVELTPATIDLEFAGDMAGLYQVIWFVLEANYSNFFSMMGIGSQSIQQTIKQGQDTKKTYKRA